MGTLNEDLAAYEQEFYTRQDLQSGFKLVKSYIVEVGGGLIALMAIGGLLAAIASAVPVVGIFLTAGAINAILRVIAQQYDKMSTEERKQLRAVTKFIQGGFSMDSFPG